MLGVLYAIFLIQSVLYTFLLTETLATFVGISVLGGIVWPRANRWGALASLLGALATNFFAVLPDRPAAGSLGLQRLPRRAGRRHRRTRRRQPDDAARAAAAHASFFDRLQTSSDEPERRRPLLLVDLLRPRGGWRAYADDIKGFALAWLVVIALIAVTAAVLAW